MSVSPMKVCRAVCAIAGALIFLGGCATAPTPSGINDPYEESNRARFAASTRSDQAVLRPVAMAYGEAVPEPVRRGVNNFAENLDTPRYIVNDVLQGQVDDAVHNLFRFVLNTTIGVGGLFDPAESFGLEQRNSDFGETLHVWGASEGAYLVVPIIGPSTERDAAGALVDLALNPMSYVIPSGYKWINPAGSAAKAIDTRYRFRVTIDDILYESADSYAQSRTIYLQNRRFLLGGEDEAYFDPYDDLYGE